MSGYSNKLPVIKSLKFTKVKIEILLVDGRCISAPLNKFPGIKKLSPAQKKKYHIIAGLAFDFDDSDEVYHISEFLGIDNSQPALEKKIKPEEESHLSLVAEPQVKYIRKK
jgi:hypothetical protein